MASLVQQPKQKKPKLKSTQDTIQQILAPLAPVQLAFLLDKARFKIARAGRRGGKSYVDAALMLHTCLTFKKAPVAYFGLTRDSAKKAIWETLTDIIEACKVDCVVTESQLRVDFPDGGSINLYGADMEQMADRFRGRKFKLVVIDECGFYQRVGELVTRVLLPTLADMQGSIAMTSSPPELPMGLFYEADQGDKKAHWSRYHWTLLDNPHFQKPSETIDPETGHLYPNKGEEELALVCVTGFDGDRNHPEFRREYLGEWVLTRHSLVYPLKDVNRLSAGPFAHRPKYQIGVNLSCYGRQSYVVLQFSAYQRYVTVVDSGKCKCKNLNELATLLSGLCVKYNTDQLVCYLNKEPVEILDDFKQRYAQIPLIASKYDKLPFFQTIVATDMDSGFINVLNDNVLLLKEFDKIVRNEDGVEVSGQETLLADAFFVGYLSLYNNHLKSIQRPETIDERIERELSESAFQELQNLQDELGTW